jgi:glycosyltransferase involved in cell wall biosynthesis
MPKIPRLWWPLFSFTSVLFASILDFTQRFDVFYFADILTPFFAELLLRRRSRALEVNGIFSEELFKAHRFLRNQLVRKLVLAFEAHVLRNVSVCVCVCGWLQREMIERCVKPERTMLVPNGVDPGTFNPSVDGREIVERHTLDGYKVVMFVGAFTGQHDIPLLIRSMKLVKEKRTDVRLVLVGDGPTRRSLEELTRSMGLERQVVFTGKTAHERVPRYLAASHVTVAPLTHGLTVKEMIPLKVLEYWAMAKPVVTTQAGVGGIPEARHETNVLIVEEDPISMAAGILRVLKDDELAKKLGDCGRETVEKRYTWASVVDRLIWELNQTVRLG